MSDNALKIIYNDSITTFPSIMPTTMMPTILITNNNPTVNLLMTAWVIIQIFFFLFLSFSIMTMISYIFRIRLAREVIQS